MLAAAAGYRDAEIGWRMPAMEKTSMRKAVFSAFALVLLTGCAQETGPSFFNHLNLHSASANQLKDRVDQQQQKAQAGQLPKPVTDPDIYQDFRT